MFKTRCPDCSREVWYFDCSCGSRVFFDTKGPPWDQHMDSCPTYKVREAINEGMSPEFILREVRKRDRSNMGSVITFLEKITSPGKRIKHVVLPIMETVSFSGVLYSIQSVNFFRRLDLPENEIFQKLLGDFSKKTYYEMIVESQRDQHIVDQWTFFIEGEVFGGLFPSHGTEISGLLKGEVLFEDTLIWTVVDIDW
jgi:hypothetical protein